MLVAIYAKETTMSSGTHSACTVGLVKRSAIVGAVIGAMLLASPLASAQTAAVPAAAPAATPAAPAAAAPQAHRARRAHRAETVEQRIALLHAELKITAAEENDWKPVAQAMRDNAAALEKLASDKSASLKQGVTAVDDLEIYAAFAQAHVDGLKTLIGAFTTLYNSFPDAQKKLADQVFEKSRRHPAVDAG
jgi:hypothetical protein